VSFDPDARALGGSGAIGVGFWGLFVIASAILAFALNAQDANKRPLVHRGAHVRVMRKDSNVWRDGFLAGVDTDRVLVQQGGAGEIIAGLPVDTFTFASTRAVQVSRGMQAHVGTAVGYAVFGFVVGAGIALVAKSPMSLPVLGLGGLTAGAIIGADQKSESWAPLDEKSHMSIRIIPASRHTIVVGFSVPFSP
jgi:hypothetical protein